ncbi:MAG: hypothetical protein KAU94_12730, partial [Verrucomicrobia bacterium]|nr:hypothetical protein [Verrucomicrobiota bacterium]
MNLRKQRARSWGVLLLVGVVLQGLNPVFGEMAQDWPIFRGPWGNGRTHSPQTPAVPRLPLHWSETDNVRWKTPIPHEGWSTPVVMDGQVWVS